MPYYKWTGIDYWGQVHYGKQFAHSKLDLQEALFQQDIGLIRAYQPNWFTPRVNTQLRGKFIQHLAALLKAQIRLHQALPLVIDTISHRYFKKVLQEISFSVSEGVPFHEAVSHYPHIFDELFVSLVFVGQEAGKLPESLEKLAIHTQEIEQFKSKVRQALLGPLLTFSAFLSLLFTIFVFVIPRFELYFAGHRDTIPKSTQLIFNISHWMRSGSCIFTFGVLILIFFVLQLIARFDRIKIFIDRIVWYLPGLQTFLQLFYYAKFLHLTGILLQSGILLPEAVKLARTVIKNRYVASAIENLEVDILAGKKYAQAMAKNKIFNGAELIALVTVGEESGNLSYMVNQASEIYRKRIYALLHRITTLIQPLFLICLGLSIAALMCALYMPLLTLSYTVT